MNKETKIRWLLANLYAEVVENYNKNFLPVGQTISDILKEWGIHKNFWINMAIVSVVLVAITGFITIDRTYSTMGRGYALEAIFFSLGLLVLSFGKLSQRRREILAPLDSFIKLFSKPSIFARILSPGGSIPEKARQEVFEGFVELARQVKEADDAERNRRDGFVDEGYEWDMEKLREEKKKCHSEYDTAVEQAIKLGFYNEGDRGEHFLRACRGA